MHISKKKVIFSQVKYKKFIFHCQVFIFHCQGTELRVKHYTTKCKICFSSSINFVDSKKKIQIFGVNMNFISSNEMPTPRMKYSFIFFFFSRHSMK